MATPRPEGVAGAGASAAGGAGRPSSRSGGPAYPPGAGPEAGSGGTPGGGARGGGGEAEAIAFLAGVLPSGPPGEVWLGDDAAVLHLDRCGEGSLLLAADAVVAGLDADLSLTTLADLGWKALAVNVSDVAAMGGRPLHAVVTVVGASLAQLEELYEGIVEAAAHFGCPVVGGDLSGGEGLSVSVAVTGWCDGQAVLRSGARPGDRIWVTGALGAANAGLRALQARGDVPLAPDQRALALAHARPRPVVAAGTAAREAGATAMVDVSDGLLSDLGHIADRSGVGFHLADVPVAPGATLEDALSGGDDYVLVFTAPDGTGPGPVFRARGLAEPLALGRCLPDPSQRLLRGRSVGAGGWQHRLG